MEHSFDMVFFDIDDTLYDQAKPFAYAVHKVYGDVPGATDTELFSASRAHSAQVFAAFSRGELPTDYIYTRRMVDTLADFGVSISDELALKIQRAYERDTGKALSLSRPMQQCLERCSSTCRVGVITNGAKGRQMGKLRLLHAWKWIEPDAVFISDKLGMAKPDPAIFRYACKSTGTRPERCLYIGDSYDNDVVGAVSAGMPVVWLNRRKKTRPADGAQPTGEVASDTELLDLLERILQPIAHCRAPQAGAVWNPA